jgi:hypothetical protein
MARRRFLHRRNSELELVPDSQSGRVSVDDLPNLRRWMAAIERRPGSTKGVAVPHVTHYNDANEHETDKFVSKIQGIAGR